MTFTTTSRRGLLAGALSLAVTQSAFAAEAAADATVTIPVQGREVSLSLWKPASPRGVILFSHGAGSWPWRYHELLSQWRDAGFLVVAPLHMDSQKHPNRQTDLKAALGLRVADMVVAGTIADRTAAGLPRGAAGHSYGALGAMIAGGALEPMISARDKQVKAVVAISSPGVIPGLIAPNAYQSLAVPSLTITGDADVVPHFVTAPKDHLRAFETAPAGDRYAMVLKGGTHDLIGLDFTTHPATAEAAAVSTEFLKAEILGDATAAAALKARKSDELAEFLVR
ncbi:MAG: alpha/beta hydrolase [Caulobacter sp.]